jgi:hypothetical protein
MRDGGQGAHINFPHALALAGDCCRGNDARFSCECPDQL